MGRRILITHDNSETSHKAMQWIIDKKVVLDTDQVTIVTVANEDFVSVEGSFGLEAALISPINWGQADYDEHSRKLKSAAEELLTKVSHQFQENGINATAKVLAGNPGDAVAEEAEENEVDMVIVGTRGLGFLKRQLLGSVSEYLIHHVKCSVLIVKP